MEEGRIEMIIAPPPSLEEFIDDRPTSLPNEWEKRYFFFFFFLRLRDRDTRIEPFETTTTIAVVGRTKVDRGKS